MPGAAATGWVFFVIHPDIALYLRPSSILLLNISVRTLCFAPWWQLSPSNSLKKVHKMCCSRSLMLSTYTATPHHLISKSLVQLAVREFPRLSVPRFAPSRLNKQHQRTLVHALIVVSHEFSAHRTLHDDKMLHNQELTRQRNHNCH